jgi:aromatic-L-amino-acid decarboxylase
LLAPVELSICCFRYLPKAFRAVADSTSASTPQEMNSKLDQLNTQIMNAVQRGGEAYISNATVNGKFALRACITNFRTTRADLDALLEIIRAAARR